MAKKGEFLEYKGRPLVRCGNTIYYGSMADPFVVCLKVKKSEKTGLFNALDLGAVWLERALKKNA